eukprot:3298-Heterococcus_DN1.PRE.5
MLRIHFAAVYSICESIYDSFVTVHSSSGTLHTLWHDTRMPPKITLGCGLDGSSFKALLHRLDSVLGTLLRPARRETPCGEDDLGR